MGHMCHPYVTSTTTPGACSCPSTHSSVGRATGITRPHGSCITAGDHTTINVLLVLFYNVGFSNVISSFLHPPHVTLGQVLKEIQTSLTSKHLIVSIAAGRHSVPYFVHLPVTVIPLKPPLRHWVMPPQPPHQSSSIRPLLGDRLVPQKGWVDQGSG